MAGRCCPGRWAGGHATIVVHIPWRSHGDAGIQSRYPALYRHTPPARILDGADNTPTPGGPDDELPELWSAGPARIGRVLVLRELRTHLGERAGPAGRVALVTGPKQHAPNPVETAAAAAAFLASQEITTTGCRGCGAEIAGLNGRYACACGWVNNWSEGHTELPTGDDDPDAKA